MPARLEKLKASPDMLDDAPDVWEISSLQTQTEAIELSSLNPKLSGRCMSF